MNSNTNPHAPIHFDCPGQFYFLTAGTYLRDHLWNTAQKLQSFQNILCQTAEEFNLQLICYSLLPNHYHQIFYYPKPSAIRSYIKKLHGRSALLLNRLDGTPQRKVWYQYWDTCIREEKDYLKNLNYVFYNPLKHGLVKKISEWEFSWTRKDISLLKLPPEGLYPWDDFSLR